MANRTTKTSTITSLSPIQALMAASEAQTILAISYRGCEEIHTGATSSLGALQHLQAAHELGLSISKADIARAKRSLQSTDRFCAVIETLAPRLADDLAKLGY